MPFYHQWLSFRRGTCKRSTPGGHPAGANSSPAASPELEGAITCWNGEIALQTVRCAANVASMRTREGAGS